MRKGIFSTVVVMLAGTCWVLAQNASSNHVASPNAAQAAPAPKAVTPTVQSDYLTAPTTQLDDASLPPAAPLAKSTTPPAISLPEPLPPLQPPPAVNVNLPPLPEPAKPAPPPVEEKPPIRAVTAPAVQGLPPLPNVPGVSNAPPGLPTYLGPVAQGGGQPIIIPNQPPASSPPPGSAPPVPLPTTWTDNDPNYWNNRQQIISERMLGPRLWGSAEYLLWFVKSANAPPLVQGVGGAQAGDTSFSPAQAIDLYPAGSITYQAMSGVRGTIGFWLDQAETVGLEGSYFWLGQTHLKDTFSSTPDTILGRPFFDTTTGSNSLFQLSSLNGANGFIAVHNSFQSNGGDANLLFRPPVLCSNFSVLAGFRYLEVQERLSVGNFSDDPDTGLVMRSFDAFSTRNQFYGGQLGLRWNYQGERLIASVTGKIAYGAMDEHVHINGATFIDSPNGSAQAVGGVLALPSNIGNYNRTRAVFLPEVTASIGYRITPWATMSLGYNFMYVSEVVRPGRQINPAVNPDNFPFSGGAPASQPAFRFHGEDLWLQGLNFGLTFQY